MTSGPENRFIKSIHDKLKGKIYCEKMHNPYRGGTADVWYSGKRDAWIEYKWRDSLPKRGVLIPALSGLQEEWCKDRFNEGRTVFVVVGCPRGAIIFSNPAEWTDGLSKPVVLTKPDYINWLTGVLNANRKSSKRGGAKCVVDIQNLGDRSPDL